MTNKMRPGDMCYWRFPPYITLLAMFLIGVAPARSAEPSVTIGFSIPLTGGLAPNGKSVLLAMQIWQGGANAHGGLLGRQVKLDYYDDQSNPAMVPGIYTKLLDVDRVDLVVGFATNMVAAAMPVVMQHNRMFLGLFALDANSRFHYPRYFSMVPAGGPRPKEAFSEGFFAVAMQQNPKPKTIAMAGADAEFSRSALEGARALANQAGLKIVYDRSYPPNTVEYAPIVRAIQAAKPDLVFVASYPPDTVGMIRAAREVGLKAKMWGGGMVGLQNTAIKMQLGSLLNGIVNFEVWLPFGELATHESKQFFNKYQARSAEAGADLLGYYMPPFGYAELQVLEQAVEGTKGLDQDRIADYLRTHTFRTIIGDVAFGSNGEWREPRVFEVQFQGVKGNDLEQFRDPKTETVLWPERLRSGQIIYPYTDAQH
ncbi:MAG: amino acid ABC transporter substrate-binding protein [Acetobacteraceae bacterium]|nr:amino acid ABC transporter substrate-binding protein [Acetobacteraceae bacterium]